MAEPIDTQAIRTANATQCAHCLEYSPPTVIAKLCEEIDRLRLALDMHARTITDLRNDKENLLDLGIHQARLIADVSVELTNALGEEATKHPNVDYAADVRLLVARLENTYEAGRQAERASWNPITGRARIRDLEAALSKANERLIRPHRFQREAGAYGCVRVLAACGRPTDDPIHDLGPGCRFGCTPEISDASCPDHGLTAYRRELRRDG